MTVTINLLASKSIFHRVSICTFLENLQGIANTVVKGNFQDGDISTDMKATKEALDRLHAMTISMKKAELKKQSVNDFVPILPVADSGATLRFLLPVVGALGIGARFVMAESLYRRPIMMLVNTLKKNGCSLVLDDEKMTINIRGKLVPGEYNIKGKESSQFISGLLMALPLLEDESTLVVEKPVVSQSYINMTIKVLEEFGITIAKKHESHEMIAYSIMGNQVYRGPGEYKIEGDWSSASFWLVAEKLTGKPIFLKGINTNSIQGDSKVRDFIKEMDRDEDIAIDCSDVPDLVPNLTVLALSRDNKTRFSGIDILAFKESDRIEGISEIISAVGGSFEYEDGDIIIEAGCEMEKDEASDETSLGEEMSNAGDMGKTENSDGEFIYIMTQDHRMVMMAALASLISKNPIIIDGWKSVSKSYPRFFRDLKEAGLDGNVGLA
ncbi:MAG: hypothetical protein PUG43_00470 [Clostridiales bacterium]|nr:hypothetical protein [Clostridiales bacterium]MDD7347010.1 hypothetical protein [Clostridiales bacterium]